MPCRMSGQYRSRIGSVLAISLISFLCLGGSASAVDTVQVRKDLQAMGQDFNGQGFAKAAGNGDVTAVQLFLDAGMDVNEGGGAAIGLAAGRGKAAMVQFLLSKGAKPTANALQYARTRGYPDIARMLVEAGAKE